MWNTMPLKKIIALTTVNEQINNMTKYMWHVKEWQYFTFDYYIHTTITFQIFHFHTFLSLFSILNSANA